MLIGGAVAAVALLVTPKLIGLQVSQTLESKIAEFDALPGYSLSLTNLQSGWFTSQAQLAISLDLSASVPAEAVEAPPELSSVVDLSIQHGPVLRSGLGVLGQLAWTVKVAGEGLRDKLNWQDGVPFYQIDGVTSLNGHSRYADSIVAFTGQDEAVEFRFDGMQGQGNWTDGIFSYQATAPELAMLAEAVTLSTTGLSLQMNAEADMATPLSGGLYDSTANLVADSLVIENQQEGQRTELTGLAMHLQSKLDEASDTGNMQLEYKLASVQSEGFTGQDLQLALQFNNLSLDFIKAYQAFSKTALESTDPERYQAELVSFMQNNLLMLLSENPELNIASLSGTVTEGSFKGYLNSKLLDVTSLPQPLNDNRFWLNHLNAESELELDKGVALWLARQQVFSELQQNVPPEEWDEAQMQQVAEQQAPMLLANFVQQGLLMETPSGYKARFNLTDGQAVLNGNPMPLPI
nr:DUF945 family protein [Bowmanella dokdonensis]